MKALRHAAVIAAALAVLLGIPYLSTGHLKTVIEGTDAVSSASVIVDQPSGEYVVMINLDRHRDSDALAQWRDFFEGREVSFIFEDISCTTSVSDPNGRTMAESYRSRLPENQMKLRSEDATLMLSKAEHGLFDIIIMSEEIADAYKASTAYGDNVEVLYVKGLEGGDEA